MDISLIVAVLVFLVTYAILASEKINRTVIVIVGSIVLLIAGVLTLNEAINYVNWETIGLLFGMFIIVVVLSDAGFFSYLSLILAKRLDFNPTTIFIVFPVLAGFLAAFLDSITVMLFLVTLTYEICKLLKIDPVPLVVGEVVLANIGGSSTLVGDPPNVILGTQLGFGFNEFVVNNGPIAIIAALSAVGVLFLANRGSTIPRGEIDHVKLSKFDPREAIVSTRNLNLGLGALGAAILLLILHSYIQQRLHIPLTVALAALIPAFTLLVLGGRDLDDVLKKVDYDVLLFFIGLFVIVGGLEKTGAIGIIANVIVDITSGNNLALILALLWGSAIVSAFIDNVPFALTMSYVIKDISLLPLTPALSIMVWAVSLGADIGGNGTPIGASANVVAYNSMDKHGILIGWIRWIKIAVPPTMVALIICNIGLYVKYLTGFY